MPMSKAFGPLNNRKADRTVGQTYGERREKTTQSASQTTQGLFQRIRDRFTGAKNPSPAAPFASKDDRYLDPHSPSAKAVIERKNRLEAGGNSQARVQPPPKDRYVGFLDSVIKFLEAKKQ